MSFRSYLFLLFSGIILVLLGLQWLLMSSLTDDVSRKVGEAAFSVSRDTASVFIFNRPKLIAFSSNENRSKTLTRNEETHEKIEHHYSQQIEQVFSSVEIQLDSEKHGRFINLKTAGFQYQIPIPRTAIEKSLDTLSQNMLFTTLIVAGLGIILAAFIAHRLSKPLTAISHAANQLGQGELGKQINSHLGKSQSELKNTIAAFNTMSKQLYQLDKKNRSLQEQQHLSELGEVARGLAHTLRNPLNTLSLTISELEKQTEAEKRQQLTHVGRKQIHRIDQWIRSFMTLMSSDINSKEAIDLETLIKQVITETKNEFNRIISIHFTNTGKQIITIFGIEAELKAILQALLVNAIEASDAQQDIHISLQQEQQIKIQIIDQGSGVDKKIKDKLFTPHNSNKPHGSGMGLFIAQRLAKTRYGGDILLMDNQPQGTIAILLLSQHRNHHEA